MDYSFHNNRKIDRYLNRIGLKMLIKYKNRFKTIRNIRKNRLNQDVRKLEIGPGLQKITDFETLNIIDGKNVDYICDLNNRLPFEDCSFDLIYASHVMEHVPWYLQRNVFKELYRVLKPDGCLEVWVPDGFKIINVVYDFEVNNIDNIKLDGWYRFNDEKDVITWANGRIFTYGDGTGDSYHPNWHKTLFTQKYLERNFDIAGFIDIQKMDNSEVRGYDHGWINLGVKGIKK